MEKITKNKVRELTNGNEVALIYANFIQVKKLEEFINDAEKTINQSFDFKDYDYKKTSTNTYKMVRGNSSYHFMPHTSFYSFLGNKVLMAVQAVDTCETVEDRVNVCIWAIK